MVSLDRKLKQHCTTRHDAALQHQWWVAQQQQSHQTRSGRSAFCIARDEEGTDVITMRKQRHLPLTVWVWLTAAHSIAATPMRRRQVNYSSIIGYVCWASQVPTADCCSRCSLPHVLSYLTLRNKSAATIDFITRVYSFYVHCRQALATTPSVMEATFVYIQGSPYSAHCIVLWSSYSNSLRMNLVLWNPKQNNTNE